MLSSCAVSGGVTMPWQPAVAPAAPLAHTSSPSSYPPIRTWSPHVPPARRLCVDARSGSYSRATLNRTFIATTAWTASRGNGGSGCQRDSFERRWDDWHRGRPECAKCSNESSMVSLPDQRSAESANLFWSPSSFCIDQIAPPILIPEGVP
jgi:hypothetical protein